MPLQGCGPGLSKLTQRCTGRACRLRKSRSSYSGTRDAVERHRASEGHQMGLQRDPAAGTTIHARHLPPQDTRRGISRHSI